MSRKSVGVKAFPSRLERRLARLGSAIQVARKRRRLSEKDLADRALVSRETVRRLERGDSGVSIGVLLSILWALQLDESLDLVAAADPQGEALAQLALPRRIRKRAEEKHEDL